MASYSSYVIDSSIEKRVTNRRKKEHTKSNKEKDVRNSIRLQKLEKGRGMINNQRVSGEEVNIYLPVPKNVCNICWKICKTESAKVDHLKDKSGAHKAMKLDFFCQETADCGCVYTNESDLSVHVEYHDDHHVDDFLLNDDDDDGVEDEDHDNLDDDGVEDEDHDDLDDDGDEPGMEDDA